MFGKLRRATRQEAYNSASAGARRRVSSIQRNMAKVTVTFPVTRDEKAAADKRSAEAEMHCKELIKELRALRKALKS